MTSLPSVTPKTESSGPSSRSSTTMEAPLRPKRPSTRIASIAASDSLTIPHTITPLPSARPSALLDSIRPAPRFGPKTLKPALRSASPTPASTADSGPRITRPSRSCLAKSTMRTTSAAPIATLRAMPPVPPLPGAQKTRSTSSDWTHFQTSACSRAPEPTTRTFTGRSVLFPLDGSGRLARDVEHHPVDSLDLVHDPVADAREHLVRHAGPVRGHGVLAGDHAHRDHVGVGAVVAHHTHRLERGENRERLPDLPVQAVALDLVDHDPVRIPHDFEALGGYLAERLEILRNADW